MEICVRGNEANRERANLPTFGRSVLCRLAEIHGAGRCMTVQAFISSHSLRGLKSFFSGTEKTFGFGENAEIKFYLFEKSLMQRETRKIRFATSLKMFFPPQIEISSQDYDNGYNNREQVFKPRSYQQHRNALLL